MKKNIIITLILLLSACTFTKSYNTPFINADETIQLQEGMSKQDVLQKVGEPFYVDYGINGTVVWIYEVRSINVKSNLIKIRVRVRAGYVRGTCGGTCRNIWIRKNNFN